MRSLGIIQPVARSPRLFRNTPEARFTNKIHEQIGPSLINNGYKFFLSPITITHIGYNVTEQELRQKAKRNLRILLKESAIDDGYYYHLAETYFLLNDQKNTIATLRKVIASKKLSPQVRSHALCLYALINNQNQYTFERYINRAKRADPKSAEPHFIFAEQNNDSKAYEQALKLSKIRIEPFFQIIYDGEYLKKKIKSLTRQQKLRAIYEKREN